MTPDKVEEQVRIAMGELGATWEDPEMVIQNIMGMITQDRQATLAAITEVVEKLRMETPNNALAQYAEREKMGFNAGLTKALEAITKLLTP